MMKPLFLPLKTEFYEAFLRGEKRVEYRLYGKRWNEKTCIPGREIILSKGYGKQHRTRAVIISFSKRLGANLKLETTRTSLIKCYGTLNIDVACMVLMLYPEDDLFRGINNA